MTTLGLKVDAWVCGQLRGWGVHTPLFTTATVDRSFARCGSCRRVFPHWWGNLTQAELKARGFLGCPCGGVRLDLAVIPGWQAAWWVVVRGWLIRKVLYRQRLWDPRMPVRDRDLT